MYGLVLPCCAVLLALLVAQQPVPDQGRPPQREGATKRSNRARQQPNLDEGLPPLPRLDYGRPGGPEPVYVGLRRGDRIRAGALDAAGNFVPAYRMGTYPVANAFRPPPCWVLNTISTKSFVATYEYRSGRLIKGALTPDGCFVPELGSRVTEFTDFRRDPDLPLTEIYNKPDFERENERMKANREAKATGGKGATWKPPPKADPPPAAGIPTGYKLWLPVALEQPPAWVAHVRGELMELGHLNDDGDFVPDYGLPPFPLTQPWQGARNRQTGETELKYYNLPLKGEEEPVYEYRSGRLLQGTLLRSGTFVPDTGSKVFDFGDYKPDDPKARRIYNLPGELVKKR